MTRKDYEKIAKVFHTMNNYQATDKVTLECAVVEMIETLKEDNPRFNEGIFWKACGL
jgi:hypothetical protein